MRRYPDRWGHGDSRSTLAFLPTPPPPPGIPVWIILLAVFAFGMLTGVGMMLAAAARWP